jgi:divalent metal cation (Fe/Co/Zn/Cd) transporter
MRIYISKEQIKRLTGHTAKPEFLQQITWITFHHSPLILKIDTVRAFHFGTHFLVEVDIVLPEDMSLKEAHDIGEELQKKIERIPEVERVIF